MLKVLAILAGVWIFFVILCWIIPDDGHTNETVEKPPPTTPKPKAAPPSNFKPPRS